MFADVGKIPCQHDTRLDVCCAASISETARGSLIGGKAMCMLLTAQSGKEARASATDFWPKTEAGTATRRSRKAPRYDLIVTGEWPRMPDARLSSASVRVKMQDSGTFTRKRHQLKTHVVGVYQGLSTAHGCGCLWMHRTKGEQAGPGVLEPDRAPENIGSARSAKTIRGSSAAYSQLPTQPLIPGLVGVVVVELGIGGVHSSMALLGDGVQSVTGDAKFDAMRG